MNISAGISTDAGASAALPSLGAPLYRFMAFPFPPGHFTVRELQGRELLSGLYSFDVIVTAHEISESLAPRLILGQRAVLILHAGEAARAFHGVVSAVRIHGARSAQSATQYRVRLVPRLWLLKKKRRSRVFQRMRVDQIIEAVLRESRVDVRFNLRKTYPIREYCTQYEETDYHFITRLAAEAGFFFSFAQSGTLAEEAAAALESKVPDAVGALLGAAASAALSKLFASGETVVFGDDTSAYPPIDDGNLITAAASAAGASIAAQASVNVGGASLSAAAMMNEAPKLYYLSIQGTSAAAFNKVTRFESTLSVRTNTAVYREYDPERPQADLTTRASLGSPAEGGLSLNASVSVGSEGVSAGASLDPTDAIVAALSPLLDAPELERYDHHAHFLFPKWGSVTGEPELILRQERRRASVAKGQSTCPALAVGHRFRLDDHPVDALNREYVVTSVEHEGSATPQGPDRPEVYKNTFQCAVSDVAFCPPRPRRRVVTTTLTATVTGPMGEEIHTDALGQVKVQFHWDREGRRDEFSSCWIRTMQAWGGAGWGTQFIPRIGMEVVVSFDGGDPDKPIIIGCLYNGTHPPSFLLPGDKTRSGIRTQTSPGGRGHNELSFEDKQGGEQIYVRAQRDLDEIVLRNHTKDVGVDEFNRIGGDRRDAVEGSASLRVSGDMSEAVAGDRSSEVTGNQIDVTTGAVDRRVSKDLTTRIEGRERREVTGAADLTYSDDRTVRIRGSETVVVGRSDAPTSYSIHVEGTSSAWAAGRTEITSEKEIVVRCGKSWIRIGPESIELNSPSVSVTAGQSGLVLVDDSIRMRSGGSRAEIQGGVIALASGGGASLGLGGDAQLAGSKVLLNSPAQASDPPRAEPPEPGSIELVDDDGNPLAYQRYVLVFEDGSERSGFLDKNGRVDVYDEAPGQIFFPDLSDASSN